MKKGIERNIPLYYVTKALSLPYFWLPILYVYLTQIKGFSIPQTTFLLSLQELLLIFLEIPTGVIADKISRKFSVVLGYAITSIPFAILPFVNDYFVVIALFAVKATGKAMVSGADSALLYDSLVDLQRTREYKWIASKALSWQMGMVAITMLIGGIMGEKGLYALCLWLPLPLQLLGALAGSMMIEPATSKNAKLIQDHNYLSHVNSAIKSILTKKHVLLLAIIFAIIEGSAVNMKWYYPPIFLNFGFGLSITGLVMSILYIGKTVSGIFNKWLLKQEALENTKIWIFRITLAWTLSGLFFSWWVVVPMLFIIVLGIELAIASTEELIHETLDSKVRATAMSVANLMSSVLATILLWSYGAQVSLGVEMVPWGQGITFGIVYGLIYYYQYQFRKK